MTQKQLMPIGTVSKRTRFFDTFDDFLEAEKKSAIRHVQTGNWTRDEAEQYINRVIPAIWDSWQTNKPADLSSIYKFRCPHCQDMGMILDPVKGWLPCPNMSCPIRQTKDNPHYERWVDKLATIEESKYYETFTLDSWMGIQDHLREGKWLAYGAASVFSESPDLYVNLHDIYKYLQVDPPQNIPNQRKNGLLFYGDVGLGKTGLMAGIVANLEKRKIPVLMIRAWWLLREVKERYQKSDPSQTATDMLRMFQQIPVLILDEFGLENPSEADLQLMQELIRHRHGMKYPTLVTTNLTPLQLTVQWHKQTTSVLEEMCHYIQLKGEKIRMGMFPLED